MVGEAYADANPDAFDGTHEDFDLSLRENLQYKGEALAQVSAALAASVLGQDPNTAAHTAQNAVSENAFSVYLPTAPRYSQDQIGDVVADVTKNSQAANEIEAVSEMAEALAQKLPGLGLTPDQSQQMAERLVAHACDSNGFLDVEQTNAVAVSVQVIWDFMKHPRELDF